MHLPGLSVAHVNQDRGIRPGAAKGAAVHVAAMRRAFAARGARVAALDETDDGRLVAALRELHAGGGLRLVYERYALGRDAASRTAAALGLPHVLEVNAPLREEERLYRGLADDSRLLAIERDILRDARAVLAVSRAVADAVVAAGADPARVLVRPNAVDSTLFRPLPRDGTETGFRVGFHGRLRPWHGFPRLAGAVAALRARGIDARLALVGEGDFESQLGALPTTAVIRTGWCPQEEVARHVAGFDALALTYPPDAPCWFSPLKLLEAMAAGVVPVVPALGDLGLVVRDGENGLVYPAGDDRALVDALESLARDPRERARLAAGAPPAASGRRSSSTRRGSPGSSRSAWPRPGWSCSSPGRSSTSSTTRWPRRAPRAGPSPRS